MGRAAGRPRRAGQRGPLPDDEEARTSRRAVGVRGRARRRDASTRCVADDRAARPTPSPTSRPGAWTREVDQAWRRTSYTGLSSAAEALSASGGGRLRQRAGGRRPRPTSRRSRPSRHDAPAATRRRRRRWRTLPVGATFGSLVHAVLEHADPAAPDHGGDLRAELLHHIDQQRLRWPVDLDAEELADALVAVCDSPLGPLAGDLTLRQVGLGDRLCELDFELPLAGGDTWRTGDPEPTLADLAPVLRAAPARRGPPAALRRRARDPRLRRPGAARLPRRLGRRRAAGAGRTATSSSTTRPTTSAR